MASQRLFIYELPEKLQALVHDPRIGSWKRLAEFTGIPIATLKQVRDDDDVVAYSRLGKTHRDRLAEKFGFPPNMPEWIAPARLTGDTGPGPDTAEAFAAEYRLKYADTVTCGSDTIEGNRSAAADAETDRSATAAPLTKEPLLEAPTSTPELPIRIAAGSRTGPECLTGTIRLASISLEGSQWGRGTVGISITVGCSAWHGFAVQRGRVAMDPGSGALTREGEASWAQPRELTTTAYGRPGKVVATFGGSTRNDPFWDLHGVDTPIGKFESSPEFAPLEWVRPGTEISVTFGTWLGDVQVQATSSSSDEWAMLTDGLAPVNTDWPEQPQIDDPKGFKRRLISIIRSTGLNAGPDGYVELSRCKLLVAEG